MNKSIFNIIGWVILATALILWLGFSYSDLNLLLLPLAIISFSIANGSIQKWKRLSTSQITFVVLTFIASVAVATGLILGGGYLIHNFLEVEGIWRNVLEWTTIIVVMVSVIFLFGSVIAKIDAQLREEHHTSQAPLPGYEAIRREAAQNLETMNDIQAIKSIRKKHHLSLVEAKEVVDSVAPQRQ